MEELLKDRILLAGLSSNDASVSDCVGDQPTLDLAIVDDVTEWYIQYTVLETSVVVSG